MDSHDLNVAQQRAQRLWTCALLSPLGYLLIGIFMQKTGWLSSPSQLDLKSFVKTTGGRWLAGGCFLGILGLLLFSFYRARGIQDAAGWWRRFYWSLALADTFAFAGFVCWFFMGRAEAFLLGAVGSFIAYACAHPRKSELSENYSRE